MSEKARKVLALLLGTIIGIGGVSVISRTFSKDEDGSGKAPTKQEETVDKETEGDQNGDDVTVVTPTYTVLETNIEGDPVGYIEFNKNTVWFNPKEVGEYGNCSLYYGPSDWYSSFFKVSVNENSTDMVEGALNLYSDGENLCLTETAYLPIEEGGDYSSCINSGKFNVSTAETSITINNTSNGVYSDAIEFYYSSNVGGASYTLNVYKEIPEQTPITVTSECVLATDLVSAPVAYLELNKDSLSFAVGNNVVGTYKSCKLDYSENDGPGVADSPKFKVAINENATEKVEGALNLYIEGDKIYLTETVYLPLPGDSGFEGTDGKYTVPSSEVGYTYILNEGFYTLQILLSGENPIELNVLTELPTA